MATITVRNLPDDVVGRLKEAAARNRRSMEQEVRELITLHYGSRADLLQSIRESWADAHAPSAADIERWIGEGRA